MKRLIPLALLAAVLLSGVVQAQESVQVRFTHYTDRGLTASGGQTGPGVAACSMGFPFGTTLLLPDGQRLRCEDRGRLTHPWVDVWVASLAEGRALAARWGDYVTVSVERWGDGR